MGPAAVFLGAAMLKLRSPDLFVAHVLSILRSLWLDSRATAEVVAVGVMGIEVTAAVLLGFLGRHAWVVRATLGLMSALTLVLVWMLIHPPEKGCGCLGLGASASSARVDAALGILRNVGLIAMLWSVLPTSPAGPSPQHRRRQSPPGWSIIEVVLVTAVVGVLLSLALPALVQARRSAKLAGSLADLRDTHNATMIHAQEHADRFPYLARAGEPFEPLALGGQTLALTGYFSQSNLFINVLWPDSPALRARLSGDIDPAESARLYNWPEGTVRSSLLLSLNVFTDPAYWSGDREPEPLNLSWFRPTAVHEIRFPSAKG